MKIAPGGGSMNKVAPINSSIDDPYNLNSERSNQLTIGISMSQEALN